MNLMSMLNIVFVSSFFICFSLWNSFDPNAPNIYAGTFSVTDDVPSDTFLLPTTVSNGYWYKGVAYVNKYNIGRYWPIVGPQVTLYTPGPWLNPSGTNSLTMIELLSTPCGNEQTCSIELVDYPILDKPTFSDTPSLYKRRPQYNWKRHDSIFFVFQFD
jgi:hypothetical protein